MSIAVTFKSTDRVLLASEFLFARRPVVDRSLRPAAHELLFCAAQGDHDPHVQPASASVISDVCNHGFARVLGDLQGLLFLDAAALMSDIFDFIPANRIIFEIAPVPDEASRERMRRLGEAGFRFAVVVDRDDEALRAMLPLVMGACLDVREYDAATFASLAHGLRAAGKRLMAESVDTPEDFLRCRELGFDYYQGYHFAVPTIQPGRSLNPSQIAIMEMMTLIDSDADDAEIEHQLKSDVTLGLKLLRMANAPAFGHRRLDSLRQALIVVGRNHLQRWLQLMLYADAVDDRPALPLLMQASARGRLMELVAQTLRPGNRGIADSAFTAGILSLTDTLFSMPLPEILEQMPISEEIADALLKREGFLGALLSLAVCTEWVEDNGAALRDLLGTLKLGFNDLYGLQLAAYEWSDAVARAAHDESPSV